MTRPDELTNPSKYLGNELEYLKMVLQSESWSSTSGSWVGQLEKEFAKVFSMHYGICMNSGTATLHSALEASGVQAGDEVISPALTVIMDATATFHANAVPVFADVERDTFNIDPVDVERKITKKTKAIIAVGLYGLPPNLLKLREIANKNDIALIEDNAQCMLGKIEGGNLAGTIGDFSSFSFETTKHLSCGEGGILLTNNEELAEKARKIGGHGMKNLKAAEGRTRLNQEVFQNPKYLRHDALGWNYRLSEFSAAIVLAQLERVEELIDLRIKNAELFLDVISGCDYLIPQKCPEGFTNTYFTLGVIYDGLDQIGVSWADFRAEYVRRGGDGIYSAWAVPYLEPVIANKRFADRYPEFYKNLSYPQGLCPNAELLQQKLMQFKTNYRDVSIAEDKAMILKETINRFKK